jgi:GNAT superfamily N-acetyltransferase
VTDDLVVRPAGADDRPQILALLADALGWSDDARHKKLFEWKHDDNVFGSSPAWVAWDGDQLAGFRTFLRWEFEADGAAIPTVRAVDTATDPQYLRRGVFRRLTLHAIDDLQSDRAEFVFNTPNAQSRPGYLRMGWEVVGRVPLATRPVARTGFLRMASARVPAELWSIHSSAGEPAAAVLDDDSAIEELLASQPRSDRLATRRSVPYLRWRYGFAALDYRAAVLRDSAARGVAIFRVRRRGAAHEAVLCEVLSPYGDHAVGRQLVREVGRTVNADYLLRVAAPRDGCIPLPRQGPLLTRRPLGPSSTRAGRHWNPSLGDVELF